MWPYNPNKSLLPTTSLTPNIWKLPKLSFLTEFVYHCGTPVIVVQSCVPHSQPSCHVFSVQDGVENTLLWCALFYHSGGTQCHCAECATSNPTPWAPAPYSGCFHTGKHQDRQKGHVQHAHVSTCVEDGACCDSRSKSGQHAQPTTPHQQR